MISRLLKTDCTEIVHASQQNSVSKALKTNWLLLPQTSVYFHLPFLASPSKYPLSVFSPCLSFIEISYFKASFIFFSLPYHHLRLYDVYHDDNSQVYFLNLDFIFIHCFLTHYLGRPFNCQNSAFKNLSFFVFPTCIPFPSTLVYSC